MKDARFEHIVVFSFGHFHDDADAFSIRSSGANAIAQCLNRTGLNALDLRNNQIGERGVVAIAYVCGTRSHDKEGDTSRVKILLEGNPVDSEILKLVQ